MKDNNHDINSNAVGAYCYEIAKKLFPICRSITGNGFRQSLAILKEELPEINVFEVPSGTQVFDWTVPREWDVQKPISKMKITKGSLILKRTIFMYWDTPPLLIRFCPSQNSSSISIRRKI